MPEDRRLAAIMFTDIVGYTALMGSNEDQAFKMLRKNRKIHLPIIKKYRGRWLKEMGDGILASFHTASDAVKCAGEIQQASKKAGIGLRIGIHEGEVVFEGGDVHGDGVNIASRLEELAEEGTIIISGAVYMDIKNKPGIETQYIEEKVLKNVDEPVKVYKANYQETEPEPFLEKSSNKAPYYLIGSVFVIIIAAVLIWFVYAQKQKGIKNLDKSIAVLPFQYLSEDPNKEYLANGVMDAITGHLSNIEGLRVMPRTSVEQYRETTKTSEQIGLELDVSYLIEGSFLMVGNQVTLILQLITAKDNDHVFFKEYNQDYSNILKVQSELAQIIAKEIGLVLMPDEKQRMENIPTTNLTAYDFFLRARDEHTNFWMNKWTEDRDIESLDKAISYYQTALDYDSTYAEALAGLGLAYFDKMPDYTNKDSPYYDSLLVYANKAISYNDQLGEAHLLRGKYQLYVNGNIEAAMEEFNTALDLDPNNYRAFHQKGFTLYRGQSKYKEAIKSYNEAIKRNRTNELPRLLEHLARTYIECGFYDLSIHCLKEALKLTGDTANYNGWRAQIELLIGNYDKSIELGEELNNGKIFNYPTPYILARQYEKAYFSTMQRLESGNDIPKPDLHRVGFSLWQHGEHNMGKLYLDQHIEGSLQSINENNFYAVRKFVYYDIAATYAFIGEKEKAFKYLEKFQDRYSYPIYIVNWLLRDEPMFDNIREDPRFQKITHNIKLKYEAEHDNVKLWLEEQGLL